MKALTFRLNCSLPFRVIQLGTLYPLHPTPPHTHTHTNTHTLTHTHTHTHTHTYTHTHTHTHTHLHTHTHTHTHSHTRTHARTHARTHTHTFSSATTVSILPSIHNTSAFIVLSVLKPLHVFFLLSLSDKLSLPVWPSDK